MSERIAACRTLGRGPAWAGRVLDKGHPLVASSCEREVVVDPVRGTEFVLQLPAQVYAATVGAAVAAGVRLVDVIEEIEATARVFCTWSSAPT